MNRSILSFSTRSSNQSLCLTSPSGDPSANAWRFLHVLRGREALSTRAAAQRGSGRLRSSGPAPTPLEGSCTPNRRFGALGRIWPTSRSPNADRRKMLRKQRDGRAGRLADAGIPLSKVLVAQPCHGDMLEVGGHAQDGLGQELVPQPPQVLADLPPGVVVPFNPHRILPVRRERHTRAEVRN